MSDILKCIIIDDEPLARELIKSYVQKTPMLELSGTFESASDAMPFIMGGEISLVFLDINMPLLNGIEFAGLIPPQTRIIFVTAYEQYALQGFKVNALDYLLKPVSYAEFMKSVGKAVEWFNMKEAATTSRQKQVSDMITVKADYRLVQMHLDTIKYVEVQKDRVIFYRTEGDPVSSLMSLSDLEEQLPSEKFMRVHRSFIVNMDKVEIVERGRIVFGKTFIPVSDSRKEEFLNRLRHS